LVDERDLEVDAGDDGQGLFVRTSGVRGSVVVHGHLLSGE
jgi:hypothetical protein